MEGYNYPEFIPFVSLYCSIINYREQVIIVWLTCEGSGRGLFGNRNDF
jgi:hypothetical protein